MDEENEITRTAEVSIIGAIIIDERSLANVVDKINPNDFYYPELGKIYKSILKLSSEGKPIDFVTVLNECSEKSEAMRSSAKKLLLSCAESTPSVSNISYYAEIVHKSAVSRRIKAKLIDVISDISSENVNEESESLIEKVAEEILPIQNKKARILTDVSAKMIDCFSGKTKVFENRCDTGYSKIDKILMGMSGGNLIILASRPKVGKTSFALQIASNVAKTGKKVMLYSQEMMAEELCERILSKTSGVSMNKIINKNLSGQDILYLQESTQIKALKNIIINDTSGISSQDIRLECRMIKNLGLIIIDYLQLMRFSGRSDNRNQEIGAISRELKRIATDLNVPILCLSQLNRVSDENKRPTSSELRDSGELEQNCNKLMLMWCVKKGENSKTVGLDVALNRRGETGVTLLKFIGEKMQFTELETRYDEKEASTSESDWRQKFYGKRLK